MNSISGAIGRRRITLGHVNMELVSEGISYPLGMHYRYKSEALKMLFKYKSGFGLLFHSMLGRFNNEHDIQAAKTDFQFGKTSVMTFILNKSEAQNIIEYRERFLTSGEQYNYGSLNNPFLGPAKNDQLFNPYKKNNAISHGAGCTAFVVSVLDEIDTYEQNAFDDWLLTIRVPECLVGAYNTALYDKVVPPTNIYKPNVRTTSKIPLLKLICKKTKWANTGDPHIFLNLISPNLMYKWMLNKINQNNEYFFSSWKQKQILKGGTGKNTSYQIILER